MKIVFGIVFFLVVAAMIAFLAYHYIEVTRKRQRITTNDVFIFLFGGFVAGMFFLSFLRFMFGAHTNGILDPLQHDLGRVNNEYYICYELNEPAE